MFADYIKPIPKSILKKIQKLDDNRPTPQNTKRWYAYLTIIENELCKITVAVKKVKGVMRYEQVAAHYVPSEVCVAKKHPLYNDCWLHPTMGHKRRLVDSRRQILPSLRTYCKYGTNRQT